MNVVKKQDKKLEKELSESKKEYQQKLEALEKEKQVNIVDIKDYSNS